MLSRLSIIILLTTSFALAENKVQLRYGDTDCNALGTGGDVVSVGLADCEGCSTSSCLHLIHNHATTWDAARDYCQKLVELSDEENNGNTKIENSHLATILTEDKLEIVKAFLNGLEGSIKPRSVWIGLHSNTALSTCTSWQRFVCLVGASECSCKQWVWLDAIPASGTPSYWSSGQPSGAWSINGGNCAKMARDHDWRYFDDPCSTSLNFWRQPTAVLCEATLKQTKMA